MKYFVAVELFKKHTDGHKDLLDLLREKKFLNKMFDSLVVLESGVSENNKAFVDGLCNEAESLLIRYEKVSEQSLKDIPTGPLDVLLIVSDTVEYGARKTFYRNSHYMSSDRILFFII